MRLLPRLLARLLPGRAALAGVFAALLPLAAAHGADAAAGSACPPAPQPLTSENLSAGIRTAKDHGFLWRVTKDGRSSYLYGTIHAARAEWMYPGPVTLDALQRSDTLALELDVLDPRRPAPARGEHRRAEEGAAAAGAGAPDRGAAEGAVRRCRDLRQVRARVPDRLAQRHGGAPRRARPGARDRPGARRPGARVRQARRLARDARAADAGAEDAFAGGDDRLRQQQSRRPRIRPHPADAQPHRQGLDRRQLRRARPLRELVQLRRHRDRAGGDEAHARRPQSAAGGGDRQPAQRAAPGCSPPSAACT